MGDKVVILDEEDETDGDYNNEEEEKWMEIAK